MIRHESPYGQTLLFSSNLYFTISDEKLAEIEQNCANIDRETITISSNFSAEEDEDSDI